MKLWRCIFFCLLSVLLLPVNSSLSHSGRTDSSGGHTNRKTGEYHKHNNGNNNSSSRSSSPSYSSPSYSSPSYSSSRSKKRKTTRKKKQKVTQRITLKDGEIVSYAGERKKKSLARKKRKIASPTAELVDVLDGDMVKLSISGDEKTFHLYGIDLPRKGQDYGKQSHRVLSSLLTGRKLNFKVYDEDEYGVAGAVVVADGLNVNELLVTNGAAWYHGKNCFESFCSDWLLLQFDARKKKKGLWSTSNPVEPWRWKGRM